MTSITIDGSDDTAQRFTVTVGKREYRVKLTPGGKAISVTTLVEMYGRRGGDQSYIRQIFPVDYQALPGPTALTAIKAAQPAQRGEGE